ncbi:hypothetical protein [Telmatospirillum sp.]|uniref:hypothetical protein n=1 Tax=Telmatospirillum sp. TaxID=2079197 RepID=UPI00283DB395|nr:hypothetical protein [Telmatospirillum sp.]MDR3439657.1 hypothetical protein [Telmatospirillum sp.]
MSKLCVVRGWKSILNIHERSFLIPLAVAEQVLDSLAGPGDLLWPSEQWPAMILDRGLVPGSNGGHSAIRYSVSEVVPGRRVVFEFSPMSHLGLFRGRHVFEVLPRGAKVILRHTIDVETNFRTWFYWKLLVEQVHDAVIEDAFDKVERNVGLPQPHRSKWSWHVRLLRWWRGRQRSRSQVA